MLFDLSVATPAKEKLITFIACFNCPLAYQGVSYLVDLICLPTYSLDVILGMNWLSSNHVINCSDKTISITKQPMSIDSSVSNFIVCIVVCLKSLVEGAQGYMLLFSAKVEAENDVLTILVVCEFQDIFPGEVSSLPSNRDVEFNKDLVPRCGLVSIATYRMPPLGLSELKKQLEVMLEKGFTRPSVCPWGEPVLLVKKKDETMRLCEL